MKKPFITLPLLSLLFAFFYTNSAAADRVISITKRTKQIKAAEKYYDVSDPEVLTAIDDVRYPFEFAPEPEPEPVAVVDNKPVVVKEVAYTDAEVLEAVSPTIRPTGVMFREGAGILILPQGQLRDGDTVKINFRGSPYLIQVLDVNSKNYTLKLNDSTVIRQFDEGAGKGITRDSQ
ncbi:MAG: hypothetical protein AAFX93_14885 [Verrucomicrobiota bacterium]